MNDTPSLNDSYFEDLLSQAGAWSAPINLSSNVSNRADNFSLAVVPYSALGAVPWPKWEGTYFAGPTRPRPCARQKIAGLGYARSALGNVECDHTKAHNRSSGRIGLQSQSMKPLVPISAREGAREAPKSPRPSQILCSWSPTS